MQADPRRDVLLGGERHDKDDYRLFSIIGDERARDGPEAERRPFAKTLCLRACGQGHPSYARRRDRARTARTIRAGSESFTGAVVVSMFSETEINSHPRFGTYCITE